MPYFIKFLKREMEERQLTQVAFAKLIGLNESSISLYINDKRTPSHKDFRYMICILYAEQEKRNAALTFCYFGV